MTENAARFATWLSTGVGLFSVVVSLMLGLGGSAGLALVFLLITVVAAGATLFFGRRYSRLRQGRWQSELGEHDHELRRLFEEAGSAQDAGGDGKDQA